ncbi:MAG TPA: DUF3515 domain-containing protein [Pseudonocardiaceae bacterium]
MPTAREPNQEPEGTASPPAGRQGTPPLLPRPLLVPALGLAVLLVAGVALVGVLFGSSADTPDSADGSPTPTADRTGPLALPPVPAPQATSPECDALIAALPQELVSGSSRLVWRPLVQPAPPATVAWGSADTDPVVLRCGLERPAELTPTSQLLEVSGVQWLELPGPDASTWVAVDRPVYVALTTPVGTGTGPIQDVSATIRAVLRAMPVNTGG